MPVTRANTFRAQGLVEEGIQQVDSQKPSSGVPHYGLPLSGASSQSSYTSASESLAPWYPVGPSVDQLIASHQAPPWGNLAPVELTDSRRSSQDSQHYASLAGPVSSQALQVGMMRQLDQSSAHFRQRDFGGTSHSGTVGSYAPPQDRQTTMHQMVPLARHPFGSSSSTNNQSHTEAGVNVNVDFSGHNTSPQGSAAMYALCSEPSRGLGILSTDSQFQPIAHSHGRNASFDHIIAAGNQQERLLRLQAMTPVRRGGQPYLPMSAPGNDKRLIGPTSAPLMTGTSSRMSSDRAAFLRTLSSGNPFMSSPPSPGESLVSPSVAPSSVFHTREADSTRHSPITPASFGDMTRFFGPPSTMASSRNSMSLDESFTSSSGTDRLSRASSLAKDSEGGVKRVEIRRLQGKKRLTVGDRKLVCQRHLENPTQKQEQLAREFGVERSTVSKILKEKDKWLSMPEDSPSQASTARSRPPRWPELEQQLGDWMFETEGRGATVTDSTIREKALEIAQTLYGDMGHFKGSQGWIEKFKERATLARHGSVSSQEDSGTSKAKKGRAAGSAASSGPVRRHRKTRTTAAPLRHQHSDTLPQATTVMQEGSDVQLACAVPNAHASDSQPVPSLPSKRQHNAMISNGQVCETPLETTDILKHEDFFHMPESPVVEPAKRRRRLNGSVAPTERSRPNTVVPGQQDRSALTGHNDGLPVVKVEHLALAPVDPIASTTSGQVDISTTPQTPSLRVLRPRNKDHAQRASRGPSSAPAHWQLQKQAAVALLPTPEICSQGSAGLRAVPPGHDAEAEAQRAGTASAIGTGASQEGLHAPFSGEGSNASAWSHFLDSSAKAKEGAFRVPFAPDLPPLPSAAREGDGERTVELLPVPVQHAAVQALDKSKLPGSGSGRESIVSLLQARSSLEVVIRYLSQVNQDQREEHGEVQDQTGAGPGIDAGAGAGAGAGARAGLWHRRHFLSMGSLQSSLEGLIERETGKRGETIETWRVSEGM